MILILSKFSKEYANATRTSVKEEKTDKEKGSKF